MLRGELDPRKLAVAVQSINVAARLVEAALKAREQEELERRLTDLEDAVRLKQGHKGYGT
jgi:hypothetical protein